MSSHLELEMLALIASYAGGVARCAPQPSTDPRLSASKVIARGTRAPQVAASAAKDPEAQRVARRARRAARRVRPNWEAQARYDEIHGTDNGYDPRIAAWGMEC